VQIHDRAFAPDRRDLRPSHRARSLAQLPDPPDSAGIVGAPGFRRVLQVAAVFRRPAGHQRVALSAAKGCRVGDRIPDRHLALAVGIRGHGIVSLSGHLLLLRLLQAAGNDVEKAQQGIIYIDEIDKICRKDDNPSITRDVSGEGVQQALLKILEGTTANIPSGGGRKHPQQEFTQLDTTNILFICGGAFIGLEKVVDKRMRNKSLGFQADVKSRSQRQKESANNMEPEDLIHYGLIPEFVGRLPVIGTLKELDEDALIQILTEPKNALVKQYQRKFEYDNINLKFTEDALKAIAQQAHKRKVGARGLMMILEEILLESMYVLPSDKKIKDLLVTRDHVERKAPVFDLVGPRIEEAA